MISLYLGAHSSLIHRRADKKCVHQKQRGTSFLRSLATPKSHGLAVLLQLSDELIALLDDVLVLLVLVIGPVSLDDTLARDAVNSARDAAGGNELSQVTV